MTAMRRLLIFIIVCFSATACTIPTTDTSKLEMKIDELNRRITKVELTLEMIQASSAPQDNSSQVKKKASISKKPQSYSSQSVNSERQNSSGNIGQCNATTKKGTRCKRTARSKGYCWQHGG